MVDGRWLTARGLWTVDTWSLRFIDGQGIEYAWAFWVQEDIADQNSKIEGDLQAYENESLPKKLAIRLNPALWAVDQEKLQPGCEVEREILGRGRGRGSGRSSGRSSG